MALYTLTERYNSPSLNQTQMWNMLGRDAGLNSQQQQNFWDNPIGNAMSGFIGGWKRKGDSISNALHTTAAALGPGWADNIRENTLREQREKAHNESLENIYKNAGYNDSQAFWDDKNAAEQELFKKYGFDIDDYWNKRGQLWDPNGGNSEELAKLDATRENVKSLMSDDERNRINRFDEIENQLRGQTAQNYNEDTQAAKDWEDYRTNSYIGKKINQDQGKFLGDALTTLSTGADIAAMTTGLPMGVLANTAQGGIEGIANELSENGFQNFDWNRAGQNAAIGAASGLATAGLNKAMGNSILKNKKLYGQEGAVLAPTNALKTGANKVLNSSVGRGALSGAVGGAVGGGVGAAINGQDVGQAMLSGAGQGAVSGAVSGAAMGAINKIGNKIIDNGIERANERMKAGEEATRADNFYNKIREIQGAGDRWTKSGKNVRERWANTAKDSSIIQGAKALGDRIYDSMSGTKQGFVANPFYQGDEEADANVGYIKKYQNQGMGIRKATDEAYKDLVRDAYDEDMGGYEGALENAKAAAYNGDTNYQAARRFLDGGGLDIYPEDMFESLRSVYGPDFKESTYKNKDGSWKVKNGEYYVETMYKNQIAQRMAKDMDAMDAGTYQKAQPQNKVYDLGQDSDGNQMYGNTNPSSIDERVLNLSRLERPLTSEEVDYLQAHPSDVLATNNKELLRALLETGGEYYDSYKNAVNDTDAMRQSRGVNASEYIGTNGQKALKITTPILNGVPAKESSALVKQAVMDLAQEGRLLNVGDIPELADISRNSSKKAADQVGWNDTQLRQRNEIIADIEEVGDYLHNVRFEAPKDGANSNVAGVIKGDVEVDINGEKIYPEVVYRVYNNGDLVLHDVTKINRLPSGDSPNHNLGRYVKTSGATKQPRDNSIIPQNGENVNTYQNGLNKHINSLLAKAENGTISYDELATLQSYAPQILGSGDVRAAELAGISEDDWNAYNNGNERTILRKYGADLNNARSNYDQLSDSDLRTRESTADWYKQNYANPDEFYRLHGDINDFDNTAFRNKVTGETAVGYDLRNNGVFDDLYKNSDFRNFGAGKGNHLAGANSLDEFKLYVTDDSADNLTNTLSEWTDWQPIEDWNDTRVNTATGTPVKQSLGDKIADWMVKGGSKKGFVKNPFYKEEAGGDYTDDVNNMQINRNDMLDTSMESPETELYNQLTGNAERSMQSSPMPTTSSDPWDNLAREYGYQTYNDAIKAFAQANPNTPISAGAVTTWLDSNEGTYNPNAVAATTENPLEKVFETKTDKIQKQNKAQSIGKAIENAGESVSYSEVYDALDPKTAARAQETKAVQKLSSMGIKPRDYEEYAKTSNEVNRIASELAEKSNVKVIAPDLAVRLAPENIDVNLTDDAAKTYNNYIRQIVADGSNPDEYTAGYLLDKSRWLGEKAEKVRGANSDDIKQALRAAKWVTRDLVSEAMADKNITGEGTTDLIAQDLRNLGANEKVIDYYTAPGKDGKAPNIGELINRTSLFEQARDMGAQIGSEAMTRSASKYPASSVKQYLRSAGLDQLANVALKQVVAPITGGAMKLAGKGISAVGNAFSGTQANNTASNPQTEVYDLLNRQNTFNIMGRHQGEEAGESQQPESYIQQASAESGYVAPLGVTTSTYGTGASTGASSLEDLANTGASTATTSTSLADTLSGNNAGGKYAGRFSNTGNSQVDLLGRAMELAMEADDAAAFGTLYGMYNSAIQNLSSGNNLSAAQQTQIAKFDTAEDAINELESLYNQAGGGQGIITGNIRNLAGNWSLDSDARTYNQMAEGLVNQIAQAIGKTDSLNTEGEVKRALQLVPSLTDDAQTAENKLRTLREMLAQTKANYYGAYGVSY